MLIRLGGWNRFVSWKNILYKNSSDFNNNDDGSFPSEGVNYNYNDIDEQIEARWYSESLNFTGDYRGHLEITKEEIKIFANAAGYSLVQKSGVSNEKIREKIAFYKSMIASDFDITPDMVDIKIG